MPECCLGVNSAKALLEERRCLCFLYSKSTVEPVFGVIKQVMGCRRFHLRGFNAVRGEWDLVCMAWNLKRLHALAA